MPPLLNLPTRRCKLETLKADAIARLLKNGARQLITDELQIKSFICQPFPRSSRDLYWLANDHICSILQTTASCDVLIEKEIVQSHHCWMSWVDQVIFIAVDNKKSRYYLVKTCLQRSDCIFSPRVGYCWRQTMVRYMQNGLQQNPDAPACSI